MAVSCPWGHNKGHLGLLQDPALNLARNGASFNIPAAEPPSYPVVPADATTHQYEELRAQNTAACKVWTTYRLVCAITHDQFAAAIDDVFYAVLNNPIKGLNGIDQRMLVHHIATTYVQISQPDLDNNLANFNTGIDPGLPLAVYTRKQESCQVFALYVAVPISKATMVTTGTKHALACGNMTMAWCKWNHCAIADHTWPNWKTHLTSAFAKMCNINHMTAGKAAFGTNSAEEEEHQARKITASLDNLANTLIQKNVTINNLIASNAQLAQALQEMQAAMVHMFPAGQMHASPYQPPTWVPTPADAAVPPTASPALPPATRQAGLLLVPRTEIKVRHTSATCSFRSAGHQRGATQANTMGGSIYNAGYPFCNRAPPPAPT
jgi:hypothetical protein